MPLRSWISLIVSFTGVGSQHGETADSLNDFVSHCTAHSLRTMFQSKSAGTSLSSDEFVSAASRVAWIGTLLTLDAPTNSPADNVVKPSAPPAPKGFAAAVAPASTERQVAHDREASPSRHSTRPSDKAPSPAAGHSPVKKGRAKAEEAARVKAVVQSQADEDAFAEVQAESQARENVKHKEEDETDGVFSFESEQPIFLYPVSLKDPEAGFIRVLPRHLLAFQIRIMPLTSLNPLKVGAILKSAGYSRQEKLDLEGDLDKIYDVLFGSLSMENDEIGFGDALRILATGISEEGKFEISELILNLTILACSAPEETLVILYSMFDMTGKGALDTKEVFLYMRNLAHSFFHLSGLIEQVPEAKRGDAVAVLGLLATKATLTEVSLSDDKTTISKEDFMRWFVANEYKDSVSFILKFFQGPQ